MTSAPITWSATIFGEPASKSNSRQLVWRGKRPAFIKSRKAQQYVRDAVLQILPPARPFDQPVRMDCTIYYRTERPDLDDSLICDVLQAGGVVKNDRLIREKHIAHGIDRDNPRAKTLIKRYKPLPIDRGLKNPVDDLGTPSPHEGSFCLRKVTASRFATTRMLRFFRNISIGSHHGSGIWNRYWYNVDWLCRN